MLRDAFFCYVGGNCNKSKFRQQPLVNSTTHSNQLVCSTEIPFFGLRALDSIPLHFAVVEIAHAAEELSLNIEGSLHFLDATVYSQLLTITRHFAYRRKADELRIIGVLQCELDPTQASIQHACLDRKDIQRLKILLEKLINVWEELSSIWTDR